MLLSENHLVFGLHFNFCFAIIPFWTHTNEGPQYDTTATTILTSPIGQIEFLFANNADGAIRIVRKQEFDLADGTCENCGRRRVVLRSFISVRPKRYNGEAEIEVQPEYQVVF